MESQSRFSRHEFAPARRLKLQWQTERIAMKANGAVHIGNKLDRVGEFRRHVLSFTADRVAQPEATLLGCKFAQPCLAGRRARHAVPRLTALCSEAVIQAHFLA